jgi:tight adherence protein B
MQLLVAIAAICAALASFAWLMTPRSWCAQRRLHMICAVRATDSERIGIAAMLAALKARVRSGASLRQAFVAVAAAGPEESSVGRQFTNYEELRTILRSQALEQETEEQVSSVAAELELAYRLGEQLGCEAGRCLDAVAASYRRSQLLHKLRRSALTMPEATIRLLSALPVVTLLLGELLGAKPLVFLLGSTSGWICLAVGVLAYGVGLIWVWLLLHSLRQSVQGDAQDMGHWQERCSRRE